MKKLDFLICGSPNDAFYSQIAFFAYCLEKLGGAYAKARLVVVFERDGRDCFPKRWAPHFEGAEVHWVDAIDEVYSAQHYKRFELIRDDADLVILCDADVALLRPFDGLIDELIAEPALAGVIAHYHFPREGRERLPRSDWEEISSAVIDESIALKYHYGISDFSGPFTAPFYVNYGVLVSTPALLKALYSVDVAIRQRVVTHFGAWWAAQISLALSAYSLRLPTRALPNRYNYANDPNVDMLYPDEMQHIVFLHYVRTEYFDRHHIFANAAKFEAFLAMPLEGSNKVFQEFVRKMSAGKYPFGQEDKRQYGGNMP